MTFHRSQDPTVILRIDCDEECFKHIFENLRHERLSGGRLVIKNSEFDNLLQPNWHMRIINIRQKFCSVFDNTIVVKLSKHRPLKEYIKDGNNLLQQITDRGHFLFFRFVKTEGKL